MDRTNRPKLFAEQLATADDGVCAMTALPVHAETRERLVEVDNDLGGLLSAGEGESNDP